MDGYSPSHILLIYGHFTGVDPPKCHFWTVEKPVNFAMESFSVDVAWCVVNPWNLLHHEKQRGHSTMHSETEWWTCLGSLGSYCIFFTTYFMVVEGSIMETTIVTLVLFLDGPESLVHCCDHPKFWVNLPKGSWKNCHGMRPLLTHNFRGSTSITSWMAEDGNWGFWSHTSLLMGAHWNTWKSLRKFIWAWFHPQFCYSKIVASRLPIAQPHHQNPYVGLEHPWLILVYPSIYIPFLVITCYNSSQSMTIILDDWLFVNQDQDYPSYTNSIIDWPRPLLILDLLSQV